MTPAQFCYTALLGLFLAACDAGGDGSVRASGLTLYESVSADNVAVAYLTLHNETNAAVTITHVTSDRFGNVRMHETRLDDGISSMRPLPELVIAPGQSVVFEPGGKHIMLRAPATRVVAGTPVTLRFHDRETLVLELEGVLQARS